MTMSRLLDHLTLRGKFTLIGVLAIAMLALPAALVARAEWKQQRLAQVQAAGIPPAHALLQLLRVSQQHRGLSAQVLGGDTRAASQRAQRQADVDKWTAQIVAMTATLGDTELEQAGNRLASDWRALAGDVAGGKIPAPSSFERHTALIGAQLALLQEIANRNALVLLAEPSSYHLHMAVLAHLPRLTEVLGQLRARGTTVLLRGEFTGSERAHMQALLVQSRNLAIDARKSLGHALAADPALSTPLAAPQAAAEKALSSGLGLVEQQMTAAAPDLEGAAYF
ncbi:MAG: methyl-accepting chemotaxis protein, partial [Comamonadaceae bacterium]